VVQVTPSSPQLTQSKNMAFSLTVSMKLFLSSWFAGALQTAAAADQLDPAIYARLLNNKPMFDAMSKEVINHLNEGDNASILDLASGPGEPSVTLATMGKSRIGRIVSTDVQEKMTEQAKMRAEKAGVSSDVGPGPIMEYAAPVSADDLSRFPASSFEAVTMSFGLMFVPNKQKCLDEIYRVLKPGGFAYLSVWKELTFHKFAHEVLAEINGGSMMPEFPINPLALNQTGVVEKYAEAAGLELFRDKLLSYGFPMGTATETADGLTILTGSSLKKLEAEGGIHDAKKKFYQIVEREVSNRGWKTADKGVLIPDNKPQLLTLKKPDSARKEL